jgi:hypothetical protein
MKLRLAKKILHSRFYYEKHKAMRPDYYDEKRGCWVSPSFHDIPEVAKAWRRYMKYLKHGKND